MYQLNININQKLIKYKYSRTRARLTQEQNKLKKSIETVGHVIKVITETHDTKTLRIKFDVPFTFKPGQFVMVKSELNNKKISRAYSISSSPTKAENEHFIDLTVRQTEKPVVSKWLNEREINDEILFKGPYGKFFWQENAPECSELLLLGGGSGITPLKSIIDYIFDKSLENKVKLLYSCITQDDIILREDLQSKANKNSNIDVEFYLTRESKESNWKGKRRRINKKDIQETLDDFEIEKTGCYLCGNPSFVVSMSVLLNDAGIPEEKIFHEKW